MQSVLDFINNMDFEHDPAVQFGIARRTKLLQAGVQVEYPLYTDEEIARDETKKDVKLEYFPGTDKSRFVLICPGGAYFCVAPTEGVPVAAKLNELGTTAFVLHYRVGDALARETTCLYDDLGRAVSYIFDHAATWGLTTKRYALCGFSAGGHLAVSFATDSVVGYRKYGVIRPELVISGYAALGYGYGPGDADRLLAHPYTREEALGLQAYEQFDAKYPPVYMVHGTGDTLVPFEKRAVPMDARLSELGVPHRFVAFPELPHGFGIGMGTAAEGWLADAVAYWDEVAAN